MAPTTGREILISQFDREAAAAWKLAEAMRDQRNQYTSRIQFGLVAMNGATLVTLLNSASALPGLNHRELLLAAGIFAAGVYFGGRAAMAQLTCHIEAAGAASVRAMTYDRAITLSKAEPGSEQYARLDGVFDELAEQGKEVFAYSETPINLQSASASCWLAGLAFSAAADLLVKLPSWWPF